MQHITSSGNPETARQVLSRVRELSDEICAGITSDYDKLRAISQWVSRNMYYDKDASEKGVTEDMLTLEHVLEYHRSVCSAGRICSPRFARLKGYGARTPPAALLPEAAASCRPPPQTNGRIPGIWR